MTGADPSREAPAGQFWQTANLPKVDRGSGCYVRDASGKRYIDGSGGPVVYCLGHGLAEVNAAIAAQLERIAHGYRYTFTSDPLEELTALVARRSGSGLEQAVFVTGGSEAVESCLKLALQYQSAIGRPARRRFIARERSWHGNTLGALSVSGFEERRAPFEGALLEASFVSAVNAYRPPPGVAPGALARHCADELEAEIERVGAERVCAFVFEPVVGAAGGAVPAPPGYAAAVREVCDRHGVLLIADEVMCGAGRCGTWRALAHDGVVPDLMAMAKGLAGGYLPLGAAVFHRRVASAIRDAYGAPMTGHTFTAHTACCAAGLAVQRIVEREGLVERVAAESPYLFDALRAALGTHAHVGDIRGRGFLAGVEFVADRETKAPFDPELGVHLRVRERTLANGLICYPVGGNVDGRRGDHTLIAPPYNATRAEIDEIVEKLERSVREVFAGLERGA